MNLDLAGRALESLQSMPYSSEPDIVFETLLLEVDLRIAKEEFETALHLVNTRIAKLKANPRAGKSSRTSTAILTIGAQSILTRNQDIAQRIHLLVSKAAIFLAGGQAAKGMSIIIRAASTAERYRLISVLIEALQVLTAILNELSEFKAARDLAEDALPRVSLVESLRWA